MRIDFTKDFDKQFAKLSRPKQLRAKAALALYVEDPSALILRLHRLIGEWAGYCSMSAGGDLRLHFLAITPNTLLFVAIGTHSQLYK